MKHVDLVGVHIEATSGAPVVLLREQDAPHRVVPIFIGGQEAASIAMALSGQVPPRPLTHDLMVSLVEGLAAHIDSVEVAGMEDGAFLATLSLSGPGGEQRLDIRPSDAIALAVRVDAPLFVSDEVLDVAGTVVSEASDEATAHEATVGEPTIDESTIEEEVAEFRDFLDHLDPTDFGAPSAPDTDEPTAADLSGESTDLRAAADDPAVRLPSETDKAPEQGLETARLTPRELADELGVAPRQIRDWLRREHSRSEAEKGQPWHLDPATAAAVRRHFA